MHEHNGVLMSDMIKISQDFVMRERSNYQLKHFVIGQHDTPEMRYKQIILECRSLIHKIKNCEIDREITIEKIKRLEAANDEIKKLKAQKMRLGLSMTEPVIQGAYQELDYLIELAKDYRCYTPEDIEANQDQYWELRLTRQANQDRIALDAGINVGNLQSLMQADLLQKQIQQ